MTACSDNIAHSNLLKRLSPNKCNEYLLRRFLKENATKSQYNMYPFAVQQLSCRYLGYSLFIRFNGLSMCSHKFNLINKHHATLKGSASTILIDLPISIADNNIISWNIKLIVNGLPNGLYCIGIVSDKFKDYHNTLWGITYDWIDYDDQNQNIYGVCGNPMRADHDSHQQKKINANNLIWNGERYRWLPQADDGYDEDQQKLINCNDNVIVGESNYKSDEIIHCEYNGKLKEFKILKLATKALIAKFKIKQPIDDTKYFYPAISLRNPGDSVQIII